MVARLNGVQEAAGSTPVTRTMPEQSFLCSGFFIFCQCRKCLLPDLCDRKQDLGGSAFDRNRNSHILIINEARKLGDRLTLKLLSFDRQTVWLFSASILCYIVKLILFDSPRIQQAFDAYSKRLETTRFQAFFVYKRAVSRLFCRKCPLDHYCHFFPGCPGPGPFAV